MPDAAPKIVSAASTPQALPAHEHPGESAINLIGWAVDEFGALHGLAVSADGTVKLMPLDRIVFDHAVRPSPY